MPPYSRFIAFSVRDQQSEAVMVAYNFNTCYIDYNLPEAPPFRSWHVVADSSLVEEGHGLEYGPSNLGGSGSYRLMSLSAAVFIAMAGG